MATCQDIPDRLNVWCCSTCAVSCLNFRKVPELYSLLGPMQWTGCTKDSSWQLYECHQLYSAGQVLHYGCDGYGWLYPRVSSGALSQAVPYHSYPSTQKFHSKSPFLPFSSLSCFSFKEISAQMGYLELRWSKHWLCLMSKSLNETPAELLRTTLMLAPQALRVTSWELPQHCLALKKSVYFTYL